MYYLVNGNLAESVDEASEKGIDLVDHEFFDDFLDENYESFNIFDVEYSPSFVLSKVDPTHYACAMNDFKSGLYDDFYNEIRRLDPGDIIYLYAVEIKCCGNDQNSEEDAIEDNDMEDILFS